MIEDGAVITEPKELRNARMIDKIAQRYSALPSQVMAEPVSTLRMLAILALVDDGS